MADNIQTINVFLCKNIHDVNKYIQIFGTMNLLAFLHMHHYYIFTHKETKVLATAE